jgi:lysylphosphatidylglycerol synthetase-like protein (DUF2156 family)
MIRDNTCYNELGVDYFDKRNKEATVRQSVRRLEKLGYYVELKPIPEFSPEIVQEHPPDVMIA